MFRTNWMEGNVENFVLNHNRKNTVFMLMFVPKEGREFEDYDYVKTRKRYPYVLKKNTVEYEFIHAFSDLGLYRPAYTYEDDGDYWGILVNIKKETKCYYRCLELGFGEC